MRLSMTGAVVSRIEMIQHSISLLNMATSFSPQP